MSAIIFTLVPALKVWKIPFTSWFLFYFIQLVPWWICMAIFFYYLLSLTFRDALNLNHVAVPNEMVYRENSVSRTLPNWFLWFTFQILSIQYCPSKRLFNHHQLFYLFIWACKHLIYSVMALYLSRLVSIPFQTKQFCSSETDFVSRALHQSHSKPEITCVTQLKIKQKTPNDCTSANTLTAPMTQRTFQQKIDVGNRNQWNIVSFG